MEDAKKEEKIEESTSAEATVDKKVEKAEEVAVAAAEEAEEAKEEATDVKEEVAEVKEEVAEVKEEVAEAKAEVKEEPKAEEPLVEKIEEKPEPSGKYKELIAQIENLSVLELSELVKDLEARFGVSAAAPVAAAAAGGAAAGAEAAEEKSSYDVVLATSGDKKIQVIKVVRELKPDLGLKDAKDLVESAPKDLLKGVKKEEAEAAKAKLEAAGATVELK